MLDIWHYPGLDFRNSMGLVGVQDWRAHRFWQFELDLPILHATGQTRINMKEETRQRLQSHWTLIVVAVVLAFITLTAAWILQ